MFLDIFRLKKLKLSLHIIKTYIIIFKSSDNILPESNIANQSVTNKS
jgi:hypothetical protein